MLCLKKGFVAETISREKLTTPRQECCALRVPSISRLGKLHLVLWQVLGLNDLGLSATFQNRWDIKAESFWSKLWICMGVLSHFWIVNIHIYLVYWNKLCGVENGSYYELHRHSKLRGPGSCAQCLLRLFGLRRQGVNDAQWLGILFTNQEVLVPHPEPLLTL